MSKEIELKLALKPSVAADIRQDPDLGSPEQHQPRLTSIYYDTKKGALASQGLSLRVRSEDGGFVQTVKRSSSADGLLSRDEWEWPVPSERPDLARFDELRAELGLDLGKGGRKLHPVMRADVERTSWSLRQGASNLRVDLDVGKVAADTQAVDLAEIEFELLDGASQDVVDAAKALAERHPARLGVLSKAERGTALANGSLHKITKALPIVVDETMSVGDALAVIGHSCIKQYRLNEDLLLTSRQAEALHQARVAMRRLRSALTFFRPAIKGDQYNGLRNGLRWLTSHLGDARNLDVYLMRDLDGTERSRISAEREAAYDRMIEAMESVQFRTLLIELAGWLSYGAWRSGEVAQRPIATFSGHRLDRLWGTIEPTGRTLDHMSEESRHELRIEAKKMRYAVEFFDKLYPDSRSKKRFKAAIVGVQEALGILNDLATARALAGQDPGEESPDSSQEEEQLEEAQNCLSQLAKAGPFWRALPV